jgi:hypothetical protein
LLSHRAVLNPAAVDDSEGIPRPARFDALLAAVDRAFEVTGADTPGWPDPHPDRCPLEEEYSRVSDVSKYRILETRVDAWAQALADTGLGETLDVPAERWTAGCRSPDQHQRVRRIAPLHHGGLHLLVATTLVDGEPFGLDLAICHDSERPVFLTAVPDCGCDACDSGSTDLLNELDGCVLTVAQGGAVHAMRGQQCATRTLHGWSTANGGDASWLDESTPVPDGVERWVGASWL